MNLRELIAEKTVRGWAEDSKKVEAVIKDGAEALVMFRDSWTGVNPHEARKQVGANVTVTTLDGRLFPVFCGQLRSSLYPPHSPYSANR